MLKANALLKALARARFALLAAFVIPSAMSLASDAEKPQKIDYAFYAPAPSDRTYEDMEKMNAGCVACHTESDQKTMHATPAVNLSCIDCHGGNQIDPASVDTSLAQTDPRYVDRIKAAHVLPRYPKSWNWPSSANPKQSYTLLNKESPEFIRFVNPSDYRVARDSCGACHIEVIEAAERSLMASGAMLWGGAAYNNGIVPYKNYAFGEAYTRDGEPAKIVSPSETGQHGTVSEAQKKRGALPLLYPLPTWHVIPPGDVFRVFERGGRNISSAFPELALPNPSGNIQRLEEPGRPDLKQSNRGPGTGLRVAIPVLNIHKTRLNDPFTWFLGTNDQPGDYRSSGCASCHVIYANDREPRHSLTYAKFGRDGQSFSKDPTIASKMECDDPTEEEEEALRPHAKKIEKAHAKGEHLACPGAPDHPATVALKGKSPRAYGAASGEGHDLDMTRVGMKDVAIAARAPAGPHGAAGGEHGAGRMIKERGHPIGHTFTRAIPTAQCMNCHMHQPNIFLNSFLGYTMWDYESDAPLMWPVKQKYPTAAEAHEILNRNPEMAATRGRWGNMSFLRNVYDTVNPKAKDTQFADYHGHGWNFRSILKRDREGNLLDADGKIVSPDDPEKFRKAGEGQFVEPGTNPGKTVHMMDIHAEVGMQCADCHFAQDSHGNGLIQGEVANAVEIGCKDCHGTADAYPTLLTSNVAARPQGTNLALLRNANGERRFEWGYDKHGRRALIQRSIVDPELKWTVSLVKDAVDRNLENVLDDKGVPLFNPRAARAKLMSKHGAEDGTFAFGPGVAPADRAHNPDEMACFTCHLSWTTSCGGCHLPIEANWKTTSHKYDGLETRNFATYNPQVARDDMFQLGRHQTTKGNQIAPVRSTSALVLSSTNINRERIYVQQPPISAAGFSSQAFAPHFPHTVRKTETKVCTDCHLSAANDNNAIMSQLLLLGTNFVNFVGLHAWTGLQGGFEAIRVTEWDEPQAVIGSYLHRYSSPDWYDAHVNRNKRELVEWTRGKTFDKNLSGETQALEQFANVVQGTPDAVRCLQLRGEYMYVAEGKSGFRVYDVASIGNKGFSERIVTAPFSPLGQDTHVKTSNATCMALATTQPISMARNKRILTEFPENEEQALEELYRYAFITDSVEGLVVVDIDTMADGEFRNNQLKRALTWNAGGILKGARHITLGGRYAYIAADAGLVILNLKDPLKPVHVATIPLRDARATALQFRYLWVTTADGLQVVDITGLSVDPDPTKPDRWTAPRLIPEATIPLADARRVYLARTYAYVAAKSDGLVIVDITNPEAQKIVDKVTFNGALNDAEDVIVGTTNASLFAYVADGRNGLKVIQLTSPGSQPNFYGFSPKPVPELIAWARTPSPALALSKGLDRDRAVDETGGQIAVFGRLGSRPFNRSEMERLFLTRRGVPYKVSDKPDMTAWVPGMMMASGK
ncbi:hypothetical protein FHS96_001273 [Sphingomonas zeicaulis]|uniref:hypothetical protein n=1 Tax=Sphingomonas zeicaulis TaxID=1632740 RepID=UPI003D22161C